MKRLLLAAFAVGLCALPVAASTLPQADFPANHRLLGIGAGNDNISVSLDVPLSTNLSLGGSVNLPGVGVGTNRAIYDVRGMYRFVDGGRRNLSIAGILGFWGTHWYGSTSFINNLELGFGLAYPFTHQITGRLNLVVPYYGTVAGPYYFTFGGPAAGLEVGYLFNPNLEGTLGANGQGGILGLNIRF